MLAKNKLFFLILGISLVFFMAKRRRFALIASYAPLASILIIILSLLTRALKEEQFSIPGYYLVLNSFLPEPFFGER